MVKSFQYLTRDIWLVDDDCSVVVRNLSWVRLVWKRTTRILSRNGGGGTGVWLIFLSRGADCVYLRIRGLGFNPTHGKVPGEVPGPGVKTTDRAATMAET